MAGISTSLQHLAGMLRGGRKLTKVRSLGKLHGTTAPYKFGTHVKQIVRRVSSGYKEASKKGKVAYKVAKKNKDLMSPLGIHRIGEAKTAATGRRAFKLMAKGGKPSQDSLHRLRRLSINTGLAAEARGARRKLAAGASVIGAGTLGYKFGKKKRKK